MADFSRLFIENKEFAGVSWLYGFLTNKIFR